MVSGQGLHFDSDLGEGIKALLTKFPLRVAVLHSATFFPVIYLYPVAPGRVVSIFVTVAMAATGVATRHGPDQCLSEIRVFFEVSTTYREPLEG